MIPLSRAIWLTLFIPRLYLYMYFTTRYPSVRPFQRSGSPSAGWALDVIRILTEEQDNPGILSVDYTRLGISAGLGAAWLHAQWERGKDS